MHSVYFAHLGVGFRITSADRKPIEYLVGAFLDAYDDNAVPSRHIDEWVDINVSYAPFECEHGRVFVPVHRARSFPQWNLDGYVAITRTGRSVIFKGCGLHAEVSNDGCAIRISVDPSFDSLRTGEHIYTIARNVALFRRHAERGNLLHASGLVGPSGAIAFVGPSMAGKTTLMVHGMVELGLQPFANDRILITADDAPNVESWPSYITLCEGTLLAYPLLHRAAMAYDHGLYRFATTTWTRPLRHAFSKDSKRLYPMDWVCGAVARKYRRFSRLAAIVLPQFAFTASPMLQRIDLQDESSRASLVAALSSQSFDGRDQGFQAWHGLALPTGGPSSATLVERLRESRTPVFLLTAGPNCMQYLGRFLDVVAGEVA